MGEQMQVLKAEPPVLKGAVTIDGKDFPVVAEVETYILNIEAHVGGLEAKVRADAEKIASDAEALAAKAEVDAKDFDAAVAKKAEELARAGLKEGQLLAEDVRQVILDVRNEIQHLGTQLHIDKILQRLKL